MVSGIGHQPAGDVWRVDDTIAWHPQAARQPAAQQRLASGDLLRGLAFAGHLIAGQPPLFVASHGHLFFAFRQPQRAAAAPGAMVGHPWRDSAPAFQRPCRQGKLGGVVIHAHQMAHTGRRRAGLTVIDKRHALPPLRQLPRAGGADDPGADHDDVALLHGAIPQQKGSSGLRINWLSPHTQASPRIVGMMPSAVRW